MWGLGMSAAEPLPTPPAPSALEAGDLIWPKKPGAIVPYDSRPGSAAQDTADRWNREKNVYLDQLKAKSHLSEEERSRYELLHSMTYDAFKVQYFGASAPGEAATYGTGGFYTGHVGIIRILDGTPYVVEAMMGKGVRQLSYKDWIHERSGEIFWVGRLKQITADRRAAIAETAAREIGQPYNFWNFDLADRREYYCSKLAWISILSVTGFAPDDNKNPKRVLWYSPKQLMNSRHIDIKINPGPYLSR